MSERSELVAALARAIVWCEANGEANGDGRRGVGRGEAMARAERLIEELERGGRLVVLDREALPAPGAEP